MIDTPQIDAWQREGYLVLPGFASAAECAGLVQHAHALAASLAGAAASVFSTRERARIGDAELMASAAEVRAFFEEDAFDASGRLTVPPARAINKIGHALHELDPLFAPFSHDARLTALCADLGLADARPMQSMLIFKQPRIGGEVVWHQDASFLITEPESVVGLWWALEDATPDNGCLWVAPGGHRGPLREVYERANDGKLAMRALDAPPWPHCGEPGTTPLPVRAGTLVLLHGRLPHASAPNRSERSRLAYALHVVDGRAAWSPRNWLQRPAAMPARGFAER